MGMTRSKTCKHFNGTIHRQCSAGVEYDSVRDSSFSPYRWPCLFSELETCQQREYPTEAEAEAERIANNKMVENAILVINASRTVTGGKKGKAGQMICPICAGLLRYTVSSYNAHISAQCSNPDCVNMIQ